MMTAACPTCDRDVRVNGDGSLRAHEADGGAPKTRRFQKSTANLWDNESAPAGVGSTTRGLTHSSGLGREGLAMQPTHTSIAFVVEGEPATKSRPRSTFKGGKIRTYTTDATRKAEAAMGAAYVRSAGSLKPDGQHSFEVEATFYCETGMRRDVDNMLKLVLDGLNKLAWDDDNQVVAVIGRKVYVDADARSEVTIRTAGFMPLRVANCEHCGEQFPRPKSHAANKYCSVPCRSAGRAAKRARTCAQCGAPFKTTVSRGGEQRYCSTECKYASQRVTVQCVRCGNDFEQARNLARRGSNSYCSPECKDAYWREVKKGRSVGTCQDCGGPTSKASYKRCRTCNFAAGGPWADCRRCGSCGQPAPKESACLKCGAEKP